MMDVSVPSSRYLCFLLPTALVLLLITATATAQTQRKYPGRGAVSAQDLSRLTSPAATGTTAADQICARYTTGSTISDPPVLQSQNGTLEVTFGFFTVTDSQGLVRYCYVTNTGLEAPTLVVNPGDNLFIHFTNELPAVAASNMSDNMASMKMTLANDSATGAATTSTSPACNGSMGTNVTNIHFHGTNIAPTCGQDEVIHTLLQPGQSFDYTVQIPSNEPPGLYWYHPHPHGISEGQVQGGASGTLIVEGIQNVDTAVAGLPERTLVIRDQNLPASEANDTNIPAWDLSINYVPVTYPSYTPATIQTNPGQQELWRVVNAAADTILNLQFIVNGTAQTLQVVSIDGYPIAGGTSGQTSENETSILLGPGARAEFVVTTPNIGDQAQLVTGYWNTGPDGDSDPQRPIANVVSQSAPVTLRQLPAVGTPENLSLFSGLVPVGHRNLYFSEVLQDPTDPNSPTTFFITEEGQTPAAFTMDQAPNIVVHAGTVEDWTVENRTGEDHIFHIHQLHFQVLAIDGQPVNDPTFRDTADVPYWSGSGPYHSVTVRMDFSDPSVIGTFVYHCHILEHEDGGMMGEIQVLPAGASSSAIVASSASSLAPNQSVTLTANVVDAITGNPTATGLVQFELNGENVGNPAMISNGQAALTTAIDGNAGSNNLTAFYEGDATYTESTSPAIPVTFSDFALTSPGTTAAVGTAAIATVTVNVANNYTNPIGLTCALPSNLTEAFCFVDPSSITGTGQVKLTVNTTPMHPLSDRRARPRWLVAGGGASLACVALLFFPRRKARNIALSFLGLLSIIFVIAACGGSARTDPGTTKGTYTVVVTGTAGSGSTAYQSSVNVPVTIQ
jgi:FtsP/CotA-like multicopper oxidase with cupredoxin domain